MTVEHEAFVDIEMALHNKVDKLWMKQWRKLQKKINRLANANDWEGAFRATNEIDLTPIIEKAEPLARTMAESALFLGASRIAPPADSSFFGAPDESLIDIAVEQWKTVMVKNANQALRLQAQITLGNMERERSEKDLIKKGPANPLAAVGTQGGQFSGIAASLMISRASTAGFFAEAQARGLKVYKISEVLDSVTCPICRTMNNREFPVSTGVAQSMSVMQATDPDSLKMISPWPSQSAANVKRVAAMNMAQAVSAGLNLPPFHPWCRGIATIVTRGGAAAGAVAIGLGARLLVGDEAVVGVEGLSEEELGNRLFGDIDELREQEFSSLFGPFLVGAGLGAVDEYADEGAGA